MTNQEAIRGSWFPSGYHGHFREKARPEVVNFYRERAKPAPPSKFLTRSKVRSDRHLFSRHDNRHTHATSLGDLEMYFEMGLGKGRPRGPVQHWKDTSALLSWSNEAGQSQQAATTYQTTYRVHPAQRCGTVVVNEMEPIHGRSGLQLFRRQPTQPLHDPKVGIAPLLAWNEPDDMAPSKPGIGNAGARREITDRYQQRLQRDKISVDSFHSLLS